MFKNIAAVACVLALSACASTKTLRVDTTGMQAAGYRSITVTKREKPSFIAATAGKAAIGGIIGMTAMVVAGNNIVRENAVDDPAGYIADQLATALSAKLGIEKQDNAGKLATSPKPLVLSAAYAAADLVLDVQTVNWSFGYFPSDWNNYRVNYSAKVRLVDTRSKKMVAEGFCSRIPEKSADAPSRNQLLADGAARLKSELKIAADHCISQFSSNVLGLR